MIETLNVVLKLAGIAGVVAFIALCIYLYKATEESKKLFKNTFGKMQEPEVKEEIKAKRKYNYHCQFLKAKGKYLIWNLTNVSGETINVISEKSTLKKDGIKSTINRWLDLRAEYICSVDKLPAYKDDVLDNSVEAHKDVKKFWRGK